MGSSARPPRARARLSCEQLEDRTTPTAGALAPDDASGRVCVVMEHTAKSAADLVDLSSAPFATRVDYLGFGIYRVLLGSTTTAAAAASYYSALPGVASAAPDVQIQAEGTPDDPAFGFQYDMAKISAPAAWDTGTGSRNFVVGVIDTGIDYTHPDLAANIWTNPNEIAGNGIDDDGNGFVDDIHGWDFANDDNDPYDDNGHGTHVSGTIGAIGDNGIGVAGVNWSVQLMALKFLDANGRGWISNAVAALNYAVTMGVKVTNNSWGGPETAALATAIERARGDGEIFVTAAGNQGTNLDATPLYPGAYSVLSDNVVTVAATDSLDRLAAFSNYGANSVTLAAPGVSILSTTPNASYRYFSGTSMATPHVTGAIALLWSLNPDWSYQQVIAKLKESVDPVSGLAGKVETGGRLDVAKMLEGSDGGTTASPPPPAPGPVVTSATFSGGQATFRTIRVTFNEAIDPASFTAADIVSFSGPGGVIRSRFTVTPVAGSGNTQFDVTFTTQSTPGAYTIVIGSGIRDLAGHAMNQDGDQESGEAIQDCFTARGSLIVPVTRTFGASNLPKPMGGFLLTTSTITVTQAILVTDLNVRVSLTHGYIGELTIRLRSPDGQIATLLVNRGGDGRFLRNTLFDDQATRTIRDPAAQAPFHGSYQPELPLRLLNGISALGTWTLQIIDRGSHGNGTLMAWSLTITGTLGNPVHPASSQTYIPPATGSGDSLSPSIQGGPQPRDAAPATPLSTNSGTRETSPPFAPPEPDHRKHSRSWEEIAEPIVIA
ncbi:MAG TPA: S8 family serine peptidase [Gemmata sp.]|nr:S8 family serine peptidase [Gemmata sp.]